MWTFQILFELPGKNFGWLQLKHITISKGNCESGKCNSIKIEIICPLTTKPSADNLRNLYFIKLP